jgi:hypothetical protein
MAIIQIEQKKKRRIPKKIILIGAAIVLVAVVALGGFLWWRHDQSLKRAEQLNSVNFAEYSEADGDTLREATGLDAEELISKKPEQSSLTFFQEYYGAGRLLSEKGNYKQAVLYYEMAAKKLDAYSGKDTVEQEFYWNYMITTSEAMDWSRTLKVADLAEAAVKTHLSGEQQELYLAKLKDFKQDIQEEMNK